MFLLAIKKNGNRVASCNFFFDSFNLKIKKRKLKSKKLLKMLKKC